MHRLDHVKIKATDAPPPSLTFRENTFDSVFEELSNRPQSETPVLFHL